MDDVTLQRLTTAAVYALGAGVYSGWGFLNAWKETENTPEVEIFSWKLTTTTVLAAIGAGFVAGWNLEVSGVTNYVTSFLGGFAVGAALGLAKIKSFFKTKK